MTNENTQDKRTKLAYEAVRLSKNSLLIAMRFLDMAIYSLPEKADETETTVSTDGRYFYFNSDYILELYLKGREYVTRVYFHSMLHLIFRHAFDRRIANDALWDLACDIAVENIINELNLNICGKGLFAKQESIAEGFKQKLKNLTAEKLYRYFLNINLSESDAAQLRNHFISDDHTRWKKGVFKPEKEEDGAHDLGSAKELEKAWEDLAKRIKTDIETLSLGWADKSGSMAESLRQAAAEKYDYDFFLKKFAVHNEVVKINDDEFDYIYYTYGLKLYKNVPLIEPLEYKDTNEIKEFVIAVDTSQSCSGDIVNLFLSHTFEILKSTDTFAQKVNIHIVQCDAQIQSVTKVTNKYEMEHVLDNFKIHGLGGTDFRPVFEYTDKLIEEKQFKNLTGLIYFTDGDGIYPSRKPAYKTAFVFLNDDYRDIKTPPWAIKAYLSTESIENMKESEA